MKIATPSRDYFSLKDEERDQTNWKYSLELKPFHKFAGLQAGLNIHQISLRKGGSESYIFWLDSWTLAACPGFIFFPGWLAQLGWWLRVRTAD